jgi:signal transduction histidine kinase
MINMIFFVGLAGAFCVLVSRLIVGSNPLLIAINAFIVLSLTVLIYFCNRYHLYRFGTWVAVILISEIFFPLAFFFLGGQNGVFAAYFILSLVIIWFLLEGKALVVMLVLHMLTIAVCYVLAAVFPQLVVNDLTLFQQVEDSIFSVLILGSVVGAVIKFQKAIFDEERKKNLRTSQALESTLTELGTQDELLRVRLSQQQLMSSLSQSFISNCPMHELIQEALRQVSEFLQATRTLIVVADAATGEGQPVYTWAINERWIPDPSQTEFGAAFACAFPAALPESGSMAPVYCNNIHDDYDGAYRVFEVDGLKSFIWAPISVGGDLWGLLCIEECEHYRSWSESDRQLVGSVVGAIAGAVSRDIIEKERVKALEEAVRASHAKGDFLSNMSHEMRTPMNAIIGMTAIGAAATDIERKDYAFGKIGDASNHLLGVINDILDMSKIEADKLELSLQDFDFRHMVQTVVDVIGFKVEEQGQVFRVQIDERIPPMCYGDDQRLAQVITNLLSNAVKFTPRGGTIDLAARYLSEEAGYLRIQVDVRDTGIGITDEQKERLFNPFVQAESGTQRKFGGTGLGLVISQRIVRMMGGEIGIESELGRGSTFSFTCVLEQGRQTEQESQSDVGDATDGAGNDFAGYHVLLAEDVEVNQEIVLALLEPTGLRITVAENGIVTVQKFSENPDAFDAILMDVQMPEMDGYQATQSIRALNTPKAQAIPIIAMTANVFKEDIEKALAAGMNDHIGKPINLDHVLAKLRLHLKGEV